MNISNLWQTDWSRFASLLIILPMVAVAQVRDLGIPVAEQGHAPVARAAIRQDVFTEPTIYEQYMLELVNRARANPGAEASRLGISLNEGLSAATIADTPKQPLAFHPLLIDAARDHSSWMLDNEIFSHTGVGSSSPGDRMAAAGYPFSGAWSNGENIAWSGTTAANIDLAQYTLQLHEDLFHSPGHRENILQNGFDEMGIGLIPGDFGGYNALMGTQNFAASGGTPGPLVTGVVYQDVNGNGFYDPGEGLGRVEVQLTTGGQTQTYSTGGYALAYTGAGTQNITFSGGELGATVERSFTASGINVKVDAILGELTQTYSLSVNLDGLGQVESDPSGIACPGRCSADFAPGTAIRLTASADAGWQFDGWSDACSGSATLLCTVTLDQHQSVMARFSEVVSAESYPLNVSVAGPGQVVSAPQGIACPGDCTQEYPGETVVTLIAVPDNGASFLGWNGLCADSESSCTLTMDASRTALVSFTTEDEDEGDVGTYDTEVYTLFIGYFGRPPAPVGVDYYGGLMESSAGNWRILADDFWNSPESQGLYPPGLSTRDKINQVFNNLFGRSATTAGLDYWEGLINDGVVSLPEIAYTVAYNADTGDTAIVNAKRQTALLWVQRLDTAEEQAAFATTAGQRAARAFLAGIVTSSPASQSSVDQAIADMVAGR